MSLLDQARQIPYYVRGLQELAHALPADDEELQALLAEAAEAADALAFDPLITAALCAGRKVDASCLAHGAPLFRNVEGLARAVVRCRGDVARALAEGVRTERLRDEKAVFGLVLGIWWCRENDAHQQAGDLVALARPLARHPPDARRPTFLLALHGMVDDKRLDAVLARHGTKQDREFITEILDGLTLPFLDDPWHAVPKDPPPLTGYTVRRAAARVGRNEPCPCGSGRKYKRCCEAKDQERLRRSSSVAGVTVDELWSHPEPHLTEELVATMPHHDLLRLDIREVAPELQDQVMERIVHQGLAGHHCAVLRGSGVPAGLGRTHADGDERRGGSRRGRGCPSSRCGARRPG